MRKRLSHAYESPEHNFAKEEIFKAIRIKTHGMGPHALRHTFATTAFKPGRKFKSYSESYEPQESCDNSSVSAFAKPRAGKVRQRSQAVSG
jgi:integrase